MFRHYTDLASNIFAPRANLKPEKARALHKRSLVLEVLSRLDDSTSNRKESVKLYYEVANRPKAKTQALKEEDFDKLIAFWSR